MSEEKMLSIEIDGRKISAPLGARLIDVADKEGIPIPRFCYHEKLSIAASCRMCLVDVEKMPKPVPACATTISDGMIIHTRNEKTRAAQKSVMEFLLINHPLDCPICDQGGECELQDLSITYGDQKSLYIEEKRVVADSDIGPLVATHMTRCIQCTRCVRYGEEIAGLRELGGLHRGDRLEITTYIEHALVSEVSANIIDLCPVGALTAKPSSYQARPWEYKRHESLSIHDGLGSNTYIHTLRGKIARVVPRRNDAINSIWISDRDRFSYEANSSEDRAQTPMIRDEKKRLEKTDWIKALAATRMVLEGAIKQYGADEIGVLISPSATVEEMHLAQKLARQLGIGNIDHRLNQIDFTDDAHEPLYRDLGVSVTDVPMLDSIFLVGADIRMEVPVLAINVREAVKSGAKVSMLNAYDADQLHAINGLSIESPANWGAVLAGVLKELAKTKKAKLSDELKAVIKGAQKSDAVKQIADQLSAGEKQWIVLGADAIAHPAFSTLRALALTISEIAGASFGYISEGANSSGGYLTNCLPAKDNEQALNTAAMIQKSLKAYILVGAIDPEQEGLLKKALKASLKAAQAVVALTPFASPFIKETATIILPIASWGETSGSLINFEGKCQAVQAAANPSFDAKPLWKVLRVLGNEFGLEGFDFNSSEEVLADWFIAVKGATDTSNFNGFGALSSWQSGKEIIAIPQVSLYSTDAYVRRAPSLQKTPLAKKMQVAIHPSVAKAFNNANIKIDNASLSVRTTEKMADNCIRIPKEYSNDVEYYQPFIDGSE